MANVDQHAYLQKKKPDWPVLTNLIVWLENALMPIRFHPIDSRQCQLWSLLCRMTRSGILAYQIHRYEKQTIRPREKVDEQ